MREHCEQLETPGQRPTVRRIEMLPNLDLLHLMLTLCRGAFVSVCQGRGHIEWREQESPASVPLGFCAPSSNDAATERKSLSVGGYSRCFWHQKQAENLSLDHLFMLS